eukprot:gene9413-9577_t
MWEREEEFKALLGKVCSKASRSAIDSLAQMALEDYAQCYKAVPLLMEKQLRRSAPNVQRVNVMFAVSKLLRSAHKEHKGKSKFAAGTPGSGGKVETAAAGGGGGGGVEESDDPMRELELDNLVDLPDGDDNIYDIFGDR